MPAHPEISILNLKQRDLYPEGRKLNPDFLVGARNALMTRDTPVASIGSCFAREIKDYLVANRFNYLQAAQGPNARHGSAAWDRVYNTFCLRQEFERALTEFNPHEKFWNTNGKLHDPYRKQVIWDNQEQAERELEAHRIAAHKALTTAKVLVITVGLTEIWHSAIDGSVFYQVPPKDVYNPDIHAFRNSSVNENLANLEAVHTLMRTANPECQIIITVSPVPLRATFQHQNVVISNTVSKAILVAATNEFVNNHDNVHYFPSYELVTTCIRKAFKSDNRHVHRRTVRQIMSVFEQMFLAEPAQSTATTRSAEPGTATLHASPG